MKDKINNCPFCGSPVDFMTLMTGLKMFYCKNYRECGAIVSFDNPAANSFDQAKIDCWNRRVARFELNEDYFYEPKEV